MTTRLDPEVAASVEARLRYYRDLGIYDFYRHGEPVEIAAELPQAKSAPPQAKSVPPQVESAPPPPPAPNVPETVTET